MHNLVKEMLKEFELRKQQKHANLQVYPLFFSLFKSKAAAASSSTKVTLG